MKEYLLVFRSKTGAYTQPNPDELAKSMEAWKNWIGGIAEQGKFTSGQPLTPGGMVMRSNTNITDAPFAEGKEVVNGYLLIKAADYNEACQLSANCPIFGDDGGSVEVREINAMVM
jgi:hypothetical protein